MLLCVLVQICETQEEFQQASALDRVGSPAIFRQGAGGEISLRQEPIKLAGLNGFAFLAQHEGYIQADQDHFQKMSDADAVHRESRCDVTLAFDNLTAEVSGHFSPRTSGAARLLPVDSANDLVANEYVTGWRWRSSASLSCDAGRN